MNNQNPVVVGVDGTATDHAALRYGAGEAARLGVGLSLVHVASDIAPYLAALPALYRLPAAEPRRMAHRVLSEAAERVSDLLPPERIFGSMVSGGVADGLLGAAEQGQLLVVGDQRRPLIDRIFTGSVLVRVAGRASTPVVAVPADWNGRAHGEIVAAIKDCDGSAGLVRQALATARDHKARLVLLHAWELPTLYDDAIAERVDEEEWTHHARAALGARVEECRPDFADVEVEFRVVHGQPARVLAAASRDADLLLLARRPHAYPWGHLGPTGHAVLRESRCPIEVLPPLGESIELEGLVLERDGEIQKGAEGAPGERPAAVGNWSISTRRPTP